MTIDERGEDSMYTVLLVDDEPLVLEGLRFMIEWERYGFRVCGEARDGEEGLDLIQKLNPDLVVTDITMPIMSGLQLIEYCTKMLNTKSHFFVLSGYNDFAFARQALTYGVLNYWLKPIDVEEIHASLLKLSSEWSLRDEKSQLNSKFNSLIGTVLSNPEVVDPLFDAQERLLLATVNGDKTAINEAARLLYRQLELSFTGDKERRKAFLSSVLLELSWKILDGNKAFTDDEGGQEIVLPTLSSKEEDWFDILLTFSYKVADELDRHKSEKGTVWETARLIRERYHEPIQLQTIAKTLHFQPAYLGQLFKKQMGMSFIDFVHRTRIEESRKLLRRNDIKISDVAKMVGYTDPEHFASKFKKWMNMTPSQYKNSLL